MCLCVCVCFQGQAQARDGRVSDAGRSICNHLALLISAPPIATKALQNGGDGSQLHIALPAAGMAGMAGMAGFGAGKEEAEAELLPSELNQIGLEVRGL